MVLAAMPVMLSPSSPKEPWQGVVLVAKETLAKPVLPTVMASKSDAGPTMAGNLVVSVMSPSSSWLSRVPPVQRFWQT